MQSASDKEGAWDEGKKKLEANPFLPVVTFMIPYFLHGDTAPIKGSVVYLLLTICHEFRLVVMLHTFQFLFVFVPLLYSTRVHLLKFF